jgi:alginate O-acetyltransferase complex protein AlgI
MLAFERRFGKDSVYARLPRPMRQVLTFGIVCLGWVFFRAPTLADSLQYCGSLFGLTTAGPSAGLTAGTLYKPYYLAAMLVAAIVTWAAPQTWDLTRRLTPVRVGYALAVLVVSIMLLSTQAYNPFIYFIF